MYITSDLPKLIWAIVFRRLLSKAAFSAITFSHSPVVFRSFFIPFSLAFASLYSQCSNSCRRTKNHEHVHKRNSSSCCSDKRKTIFCILMLVTNLVKRASCFPAKYKFWAKIDLINFFFRFQRLSEGNEAVNSSSSKYSKY